MNIFIKIIYFRPTHICMFLETNSVQIKLNINVNDFTNEQLINIFKIKKVHLK